MNRQIVNSNIDGRFKSDISREAAETYFRAAQRSLEEDRAAAFASFDDLFRSGVVPRPAPGRYQGELLAVELFPPMARFVAFMQQRFHFWIGKTFDPYQQKGDNILDRHAHPWFALFLPFYRGKRPDSATTFRALKFRTYAAPALKEKDVTVLKIDYDLPGNPSFSIRRVLDELVELADGFYLGRAYFHWWWGPWQRVAYFSLRKSDD